jgi:hypothetical protein
VKGAGILPGKITLKAGAQRIASWHPSQPNVSPATYSTRGSADRSCARFAHALLQYPAATNRVITRGAGSKARQQFVADRNQAQSVRYHNYGSSHGQGHVQQPAIKITSSTLLATPKFSTERADFGRLPGRSSVESAAIPRRLPVWPPGWFRTGFTSLTSAITNLTPAAGRYVSKPLVP